MRHTVLLALKKWDIPTVPATSDFVHECERRYGKNHCLEEFLEAIPAEVSELAKDGSLRCTLWPEPLIHGKLDDTVTDHFLPIGHLCDGSILALRLEPERNPIVGGFPVSLCGDDDWSELRECDFTNYKIEYAEYLNALLHNPSIQYRTGERCLSSDEESLLRQKIKESNEPVKLELLKRLLAEMDEEKCSGAV